MSKKIVFDIETNTDLEGVDKQINDIIGSTKSLRQQYTELRDAAAEATDPADFDKLARAAGDLKDKIDDANQSIRAFSSDTRQLDIAISSVRGIAGAFAATQGAIALLVGENENLNKVLVRVQGSLAVLNGIQQVSNTLNKNSVVGLALYRAQQNLLNLSIFGGVGALSAFQKALIATGVGAFVVALGLLIANFEKVKEVLGFTSNALDEFNEEQKRISDELDDKLKSQVRETAEEFQNLKEEIRLTEDPIDKLEKLIKKFGTDSPFAFLDPESPDLLDDINRLLAEQETRVNLINREATAQKRILQNQKELEELSAELKAAELDDNKELKEQLRGKIDLLVRDITAQRNIIAATKEQRIAIEENIRTFVNAEREKRKQEEETERKRIENIKLREQANKINEQNRIALIQNRFQRELALLDLKFNAEREVAKKTGSDIALLEQRQQRDRQLFIQNQQKALGEVILKAFKNVNDELRKLSLTTYREDEAEFIKSQERKADELVKTLFDTREDFIKLSEEVEKQNLKLLEEGKITQEEYNELIGVSAEFLDELRKKNTRLEETFFDISFQIKKTSENLDDLEKQVLKFTDPLTRKRQIDVIRLKAITDGLKFIIDLEEKVSDSNIISGRQAIENLKEQTGFAESLSELKIRLTKREAETRALEEQKVIEAISVAGDKEIFLKLKNKEIETEQLTEKQKRYQAKIDQILNDAFINDEERTRRLLVIEEEFLQEGIKFRSNYFKKLNDLKQQSLESEIRVNDAFINEEKSIIPERLQAENDYLQQRKALLEKDGVSGRVAQQKRQNDLLKLQREYQQKTIKNEIKLKERKLKILEEEMKVNPNINPELFKQIQNEILALQNESLALTNEATEDGLTIQRQIWENFAREIQFGTDNLLSSINQFVSELGNESRNILNEVQKSNRKLLEDGKITQKEFDKLQEKAFNDNEDRQEKLFQQQQQIELVRTFISGISSAQQAYQSQFLPVPDPSSPIRGAVAAGVAIAATGVRLAAIKKQKYQRAEFGGLSSAGAGQRTFGGVATSNVIEPTLRNDLDQSLRVFVLEGDITESQRRVRVVRGGANTTF